MKKKGQVTIFIIIAILIIGGVASYFGLRNSVNVEKIPSEIEPVYVAFISCLEDTTDQGIEFLGLHGGYYKIPETVSISYFTDNIPYYYLNSKKYIPSVERVQGELENYIFEHLDNCLDFDAFKEQGYEIKKGDLLVYAEIKEDKIKIMLDYPLTIKKGDSVKRLRDFNLERNSDMKKLIENSKEIIDSYSEKPGFVCLDCIKEISEKNDLKITSAPFSNKEKDSIFFLITSPETELNWKFAVEI